MSLRQGGPDDYEVNGIGREFEVFAIECLALINNRSNLASVTNVLIRLPVIEWWPPIAGSMLQPANLALLWNALAEISSVPSRVSPSTCSAIAIISKSSTIDALRGALFQI
jgi:hypothetical protein